MCTFQDASSKDVVFVAKLDSRTDPSFKVSILQFLFATPCRRSVFFIVLICKCADSCVTEIICRPCRQPTAVLISSSMSSFIPRTISD